MNNKNTHHQLQDIRQAEKRQARSKTPVAKKPKKKLVLVIKFSFSRKPYIYMSRLVYRFFRPQKFTWKAVGSRVLVFASIAAIVVSVFSVYDFNSSKADALSGVASGLYPSADFDPGAAQNNWAEQGGTATNDGSCTNNAHHCNYVDSNDTGAGTYLGTGLGMNTTTAEEEFEIDNFSANGVFSQITSVTVYIDAVRNGVCNGGGTNCDSLDVRIFTDGAYNGTTNTITGSTATPADGLLTTTSTESTLTWTGLTSANQNDLRVEVTRVSNGTGSGSTKDDDVRISEVRVDIEYDFTGAPAVFDQKAYIWENNDEDFSKGDSYDENSQLAAGNSSISVPQGTVANLRIQLHNEGSEVAYSSQIGLFYDRSDGIWSKIGDSIPPNTGSGSGCASTSWTCTAVNTTNDVGQYSSMAIDNTGSPNVLYYDATNTANRIARLGGSGCDDNNWSCNQIFDNINITGQYTALAYGNDGTPWAADYDATNANLRVTNDLTGATGWTVDNTNSVGNHISIATDNNSVPWVAYYQATGGNLRVATYDAGSGFGCDSGDWDCTTVDSTNDVGQYTSTGFDDNRNPWISYYDVTNGNLRVAQYVGGGSGSGCASSDWTCVAVDTTNDVGQYSSIAFDSAGNPWISYYDVTNGNLRVAQYVGGGSGSGCASSNWTCTAVESTNDVGQYSSVAFDPAGNPWISYYDVTNGNLRVAQYVGGGSGSGCASSNWTCTAVDTANDVGQYSSIAFDSVGNPWISYYDVTGGNLRVAEGDGRKGEILISPTPGGGIGDAISESHTDMTSVTDTANRDDADCTTGTWANGKAGATVTELTITNGYCTELSFNIDTTQAQPGTTYRIAMSTNDNWRQDKGSWRGFAGGYTQYATITVVDSVFRAAKDNSPRLANCSGDTNWGCEAIDSAGSLTSGYTSIAFDSSGNPWVSYSEDPSLSNDLLVARYVGTGGTGCGATTAWTCTSVDTTNDVGEYTSIAFDPSGNPWVSYHDGTNSDLRVARYVGAGGTGCASTAWTCTAVDTANNVGFTTSIAFDPSGNAWVSYEEETNDTLRVARYVGTGGTGCASTAWTCIVVNAVDITAGSEYTSIAFDPSGNPWVSHYGTGDDLSVARYVGTGGTGCTSTAWTCTIVHTGFVGRGSSIAFDPSGNAWVSYADSIGERYIANYVGTGGTGCTSTAWTCILFDTVSSTFRGDNTTIAFDPSGNPWVSYYDGGVDPNQNLRVARYVGTGGTGCTSSAWTCTAVDTANNVGMYPSIAFDPSGNPWVSYYDGTNNQLRVAKLHRSITPLSFSSSYNSPHKNATKGDARYRLSPGSSPLTNNGQCGSAVSDYEGLCALFQNNGDYDTIVAQTNQSPYMTFAARFSSTTELPTGQWFGRTSLAPSTAGTTGDIVMQAYRYGTTNAWETIASDTASSDCNAPAPANCSLSGQPSGTASEYFYNDGAGGYWVYFRLYQEASNSTSITFKTDQFKTTKSENRLRGGQFFQDGVRRPLNWR